MMVEKHDEIDIVVVLTESGNHAKNVIDLAKYNKHIIVEKPIALTLSDANNMIKACDANNIHLFVVKQNRFNLPVLKTREAFELGRFGNLFMATIRVRWCRTQEYYDQDSWRGTWKLDGGVVTNQASHHVDLLQWFMGDIKSVFAKTIKASAKIEAEDTCVAILKFQSGALGIIEATTAIRPKDTEGSISLLGSDGFVEISGFAVNELRHWNFKDTNDDDKDVTKNFSSNPPNVYGFGHKQFYEDVVFTLTDKKSPSVGGKEAIKSLEIINAIYESAESGQEVFHPFEFKHTRLGGQ
jgi:predicted dehydrogenase